MVRGVDVGDDREWRKLLERVTELGRQYVKVGVLADQGGDELHDDEGGSLTIAGIAKLHEYGDPEAGIEERSFIRRTAVDQATGLASMQGKLSGLVTVGKLDVRRALDLLGGWFAGQVKLTITSGKVTPPLAASTISAKGSSKPLIDTSLMLNSISHEVVA